VIYVVYTVHVVVCLFLILVVLLQQGKGADLSVFGGGSTQSAFGARGAATLLHKLTVWAFIAFIFTTIGIGFLQGHGGGGSVMSTVEESAAPATTPAEPTSGPTAEPATPDETTTEPAAAPGAAETTPAEAENPSTPVEADGESDPNTSPPSE